MIKDFSRSYLQALVQDAAASPRLRQHRNVHADHNEPAQRLFNCISMSSYIRPHRHLLDPKFECFVAVQGLFCLYTFSEEGKILEMLPFGTERYGEDGTISVGLEIPPGVWHTVAALVPDAVLLEVKSGPFRADAAKEFAPWAPSEASGAASAYLTDLQQRAKSILNTRVP